LGLAGFVAAPAQAESPEVTISSPCYNPPYRDTVLWTVTNHTAADIEAVFDKSAPWAEPAVFTIPASSSIVRWTDGIFSVEITVGGVVVASASVAPDQLRACGTTPDSFDLILDCRPSPYQITLRIKNTTDQARQYRLTKERGEELTGTALPGDTFITEDWVKPTDSWTLEIVGYRYDRVVNEPELCDAPTATPTASSTPRPGRTPSPAPTFSARPRVTTSPSAPTEPAPTLVPASSASGLDSGTGVLVGGLAGLLVGSALGTAATLRRRRTVHAE
jgi:hypothetical protein